MQEYKEININDFDYNLPDEKIAKYPLEQRDKSKLLIFIYVTKQCPFRSLYSNLGLIY